MSRLDDTGNCPVADACASCGGNGGLTVATVGTQVGVYCLTLCWACEETGQLPRPLGAAGTARRVLEHLGHVGIDADTAEAMLEAERREGRR